VFAEAQPREWAASANSSSEGLGNNFGVKRSGFECLLNYTAAHDTEWKTGMRSGSGTEHQRKTTV